MLSQSSFPTNVVTGLTWVSYQPIWLASPVKVRANILSIFARRIEVPDTLPSSLHSAAWAFSVTFSIGYSRAGAATCPTKDDVSYHVIYA
jgi:hypothetical protein